MTDPRCFVIQPFDKDTFDARYNDVFSPAISAAGFEPYRIDQDSSASIPIDEICRQISDAAACFADITLDNPNVWFELGYAIAKKKEICLVCSSERGKFPFDVQHRLILHYTTRSPSDFDRLKEQIVSRLKSMKSKASSLQTIKSVGVKETSGGLSAHEVAAMTILFENLGDPAQEMPHYRYRDDMEKAGFTTIAAQFAIRKLINRGFVFSDLKMEDDPNFPNDRYTVYILSDNGLKWLVENEQPFDVERLPF